MKTVYLKEGAGLRIENRRGETAIITTRESGRAVSENGQLTAESVAPARAVAAPEPAEALDLTRRLADLVRAPLRLEQFQLTQGFAWHSLVSRERSTQWEEKTVRAHMTVAHSELLVRCGIDRGGADLDAIGAVSLERLLAIFQRASPRMVAPERNAVARLSPSVAAALWIALIFEEKPVPKASRARFVQALHPDFTHDGFGATLARIEDITDRTSWIHFYRPSYRTRPERMPFHIRAESEPPRETRDADLVIEALLAPPRISPDGLHLVCLCSVGQEAFAASIRWRAGWLEDLEIGGSEEWFPIAAGVWGSEAILPEGTVSVLRS